MSATASSLNPGDALPVEAAYDLSAPFYDEWKWQRFWHDSEYPVVAEMFRRFRRSFSRGISLLDLGCGTGWYLEQLVPLCREAVGLDLSVGMLAIARHRLPKARLVHADARSVPFSDLRFDAILCTRVLPHLPTISLAAAEMRRVLRPGGLLVLSSVDDTHGYEETHLPVGSSYVVPPIYKHGRVQIDEEIESHGFAPSLKALIYADGSSRQLTRKRVPTATSPVVGWVTSWRKATLDRH